MIKVNHAINLVTEFDETKMPSDLLMAISIYDEETLGKILAETFIQGLHDLEVFEKLNKFSTYAVVKVAD